jgi:hypothetical protein
VSALLATAHKEASMNTLLLVLLVLVVGLPSVTSPSTITAGTYFNFTPTFAPLPSDLYKFHVLIVGSTSGLITFSDFYQFRVGGPNSTNCCP